MCAQRIPFLLLDSRDRTATSASSTDCVFQLNPGINGCTSVELLSLSFPNTQYNLNSLNNIIYFNDGAPKVATIPPGNYDITAFLLAIKTAMEAVSGLTYTATYDFVSMKITVTATAPFSFSFATTLNSAANIMGFNNVNTGASLSITAPNITNLSLPLYFYVQVDEFSTNVKSSNNFDNGSFTIINNTNVSDIITFADQSYYRQKVKVTENNIQTLNVVFKNHNNVIMDLNGADWAMLLKMNYDLFME